MSEDVSTLAVVEEWSYSCKETNKKSLSPRKSGFVRLHWCRNCGFYFLAKSEWSGRNSRSKHSLRIILWLLNSGWIPLLFWVVPTGSSSRTGREEGSAWLSVMRVEQPWSKTWEDQQVGGLPLAEVGTVLAQRCLLRRRQCAARYSLSSGMWERRKYQGT